MDPDPPSTRAAARRERLATELRANLRRRKAQARASRGAAADAGERRSFQEPGD